MAPIEDIDAEDDAGSNTEPKQLDNHCPCGCTLEDLNDRGYCKHLVGFTNDKKVMEPLVPILGKDSEGQAEETGNYRVLGRKKQTKPIPPRAKLVNPQSRQLASGVWRLANKWVSWRVYVDEADKPAVKTNKAG